MFRKKQKLKRDESFGSYCIAGTAHKNGRKQKDAIRERLTECYMD